MKILIAMCLLAWSAQGQSVIISAPSTDITPKGELMIAHESQFNRFEGGRNYWNSFTFGTIGITKSTEFAATLYGLGRPASGNNALGVGFKQRVADIKPRGWHIESTAGFMLPISLSGNGAGYWGFGNVSVKAPRTHTKVTAGPSYGTRQIFGRRTYSTIVGVEQPIAKKWTIVADWFSGTHDLAAGIAGLAWRPRHQLVIIAAYKVPNNAASGRPAPLLEVTYSFRLRQ